MPLIRPRRDVPPVDWRGWNIRNVTQRLGIAGNLGFALDPGEAASYTSGQVWSDLSGNGHHFNLGTTSGSNTTDPTFNGTAGRLSAAEHWSFDGGDYFTYAAATPTLIQNMHKNNAAFGFALWWYTGALGAAQSLFGNAGNLSDVGIRLTTAATTGVTQFIVCNGSGTAALTVGLGSVAASAWTFLAIAVDEANAAYRTQRQAVTGSGDGTYGSPSAASASSALTLAARAGAVPMNSDARLGPVLCWDRAPAASEFMALFMATRGRFGV